MQSDPQGFNPTAKSTRLKASFHTLHMHKIGDFVQQMSCAGPSLHKKRVFVRENDYQQQSLHIFAVFVHESRDGHHLQQGSERHRGIVRAAARAEGLQPDGKVPVARIFLLYPQKKKRPAQVADLLNYQKCLRNPSW